MKAETMKFDTLAIFSKCEGTKPQNTAHLTTQVLTNQLPNPVNIDVATR